MRFLTDKITQLHIGWNERPLTEADFHRLCKRFRITVQETPLTTGGFYYRVMGRDFIAVDNTLAPVKKLAVMFHELGHFLFHPPESGPAANFHNIGRRTRKESEADVFALCAVIPRSWIEGCRGQDLMDDEGIPADMIAARYELLKRYDI